MKIEQKAGDLTLEVWTEGAPLRFDLKWRTERIAALSVDNLHDLRYAIDRVLWKVADLEAAERPK